MAQKEYNGTSSTVAQKRNKLHRGIWGRTIHIDWLLKRCSILLSCYCYDAKTIEYGHGNCDKDCAAQVYCECAGKIVSAATAEWHKLNAMCQRPWMLKQKLRLHEQQLQRHESDDFTLLSYAQCATLLLLRRENDRIHSHGSISHRSIRTSWP